MAEAAQEYCELKELFKETDNEIKLPLHLWGEQGANYYSNEPVAILEKMAEDKHDDQGLNYFINILQTPWQWNYFGTVVPAMSGVSLCFFAAQSLNADYKSYLYDKTYVKNPKAEAGQAWDAKFTAFDGFCPAVWSAKVPVTDPNTLETTLQEQAMNDNILAYNMWQYDGTKPKEMELKRLKFSFAGNQGYKVVQIFTTGKSVFLAAQANSEVICALKTKEGILLANWADTKYEGNRRKWGSLKGKLSQFEDMFKALAENTFLTIDGDGF